jgi:hypothetical protein
MADEDYEDRFERIKDEADKAINDEYKTTYTEGVPEEEPQSSGYDSYGKWQNEPKRKFKNDTEREIYDEMKDWDEKFGNYEDKKEQKKEEKKEKTYQKGYSHNTDKDLRDNLKKKDSLSGKLNDIYFEADYKLDDYFKNKKYTQLIKEGVPANLIDDYDTTYNKLLNLRLLYKNGAITKDQKQTQEKAINRELFKKQHLIRSSVETKRRSQRAIERKEKHDEAMLDKLLGNKPSGPVHKRGTKTDNQMDYRNQAKLVRGTRIHPTASSVNMENPAGFYKPNVMIGSVRGYAPNIQAPRSNMNLFTPQQAQQRLATRRDLEVQRAQLEQLARQKREERLQNTFMRTNNLHQMIAGNGALPKSDFNKAGLQVRSPAKKVVFSNPVNVHRAVLMRGAGVSGTVGTKFSMGLPNFNMSFGKLNGTGKKTSMKALDLKLPNFNLNTIIKKKKKGK